MTFTATAPAAPLAKALSMAARVTPRATNSIIAVAANTKLSARNGRLFVAGTNLEGRIEIGVDAEGDGEVTAPAAELAAIASRLDPKKDIKLEMKEALLWISQGRSRFKLPTLPASELPIILGNEAVTSMSVKGSTLAAALKAVEGAAAVDISKAFLMGVHMDLSGDRPMAVASDTRVMGVTPLADVPAPEGMRSVTIPLGAIGIIQAICGQADEVTIYTGQAVFGVEAGGLRYETKVIDYAFPQWRRIVRKEHRSRAVVKMDALRHAIDKVTAIGPARLTITFDDSIEIKAEASERNRQGAEADDTLPHEGMDGPSGFIVMQADNLKWAIGSLPGATEIEFGLFDQDSYLALHDPARPHDVRAVMPILGQTRP
jgi:DNA polymerase-3 subunit beta